MNINIYKLHIKNCIWKIKKILFTKFLIFIKFNFFPSFNVIQHINI